MSELFPDDPHNPGRKLFLKESSVDWSIDWSIDRSIDFPLIVSLDWLIDWLIDWSIDWLVTYSQPARETQICARGDKGFFALLKVNNGVWAVWQVHTR